MNFCAEGVYGRDLEVYLELTITILSKLKDWRSKMGNLMSREISYIRHSKDQDKRAGKIRGILLACAAQSHF